MDFIEFCLAFTGWETANKYKITNTQGQQVFFAAEGNIHVHTCNQLVSPYSCCHPTQLCLCHASTTVMNRFVDFAKYRPGHCKA